MKLSKRNWLIRYAFLLGEDEMPDTTNLCAVFWKCVGATVFFTIVGTVMIFLGYEAWIHIRQLGEVLLMISFFALVYLLARSIGWVGAKVREEVYYESIVHGWLRDFKNKTCMKIELE